MRKFVFKIFSRNLHTAPALIKECAEFTHSVDDVFIELTACCDTTDDDWIEIKKQIGNVDVQIHAAHSNFNPGCKELVQQNQEILAVAQKAADMFNSETIIVHAGCGHEQSHLAETARQFCLFNDARIVVENLPYFDNNGDEMHGSTADEIKYIMNESGYGFCFDFSHAICAALSLNRNIEMQLKDFYDLKPRVYHIYDGNINEARDSHLHFGTGNYPLQHFLNDLTDENAHITIETGQGNVQHCDSRIKDYRYLKALLSI